MDVNYNQHVLKEEQKAKKLQYELATESDKEEILKLYKSQLGREFCAWTDHYPDVQEIEMDLKNHALIVLRNELREIIATVSIDDDKNVDELACWSKELKPSGELARLAVKIECQNQGLGHIILSCGVQELKKRHYKSAHYLVNRHNEKAIRSYAHLDFKQVGEVHMYEQDFLCFEKEL